VSDPLREPAMLELGAKSNGLCDQGVVLFAKPGGQQRLRQSCPMVAIGSFGRDMRFCPWGWCRSKLVAFSGNCHVGLVLNKEEPVMKRLSVICAAASVLALGACSREAPSELPPPQQAAVDVTTPTPTAPAGLVAGSQAHFTRTMAGRDVILFDTDRFNIDSDDGAALRTQAEYLLQFPNSRATVEGHADERGTRDYNLALGERRANAAKNYLVSLGVPESRLRTVSYGEERPADIGSSDTAWARNRRAVTVMIN
jgi:peptidoglycan-associated lipoprotein